MESDTTSAAAVPQSADDETTQKGVEPPKQVKQDHQHDSSKAGSTYLLGNILTAELAKKLLSELTGRERI